MISYEATIASMDLRSYDVLQAITYAGFSPTSTHARPSKFVCTDGNTYWVKGTAQEGLVAEIIAGRLGHLIGAAPFTTIIFVPSEALPTNGEADHLQGTVVGVRDVPNTQNARDLAPFIGHGGFDPSIIDAKSRALVIAFQSWLGVGDEQVLIRFTDGVVFSIDHGACFGAANSLNKPIATITSIRGVPDSVGKEDNYVEAAVEAIEGITDQQIIEAVAGVPPGTAWKSELPRRSQIANWLIFRRQHIRSVMERWLRT